MDYQVDFEYLIDVIKAIIEGLIVSLEKMIENNDFPCGYLTDIEANLLLGILKDYLRIFNNNFEIKETRNNG